jgi:hypothetical protein
MRNAAFCSIGVLLFAFSAAGQSDQQIAALQQEQLNHHRGGYLTVSANRSYIVVTVVEDATRLEDQLNHDPENVGVRIKLLNYYWHNGCGKAERFPFSGLLNIIPNRQFSGLT